MLKRILSLPRLVLDITEDGAKSMGREPVLDGIFEIVGGVSLHLIVAMLAGKLLFGFPILESLPFLAAGGAGLLLVFGTKIFADEFVAGLKVRKASKAGNDTRP